MSRFLPLVIFAFMPLFLSIGHDIIVFFLNIDQGFKLSSLGYIWATYAEEHFRVTIDNSSESVLKSLDKILGIKLSLLTTAFAILFPIAVALEFLCLKICFGWITPRDEDTEELSQGKSSLKKQSKKYTYNRQ